MQKNPTTAEFLLEAGASATIVDSGGNTPLHAYLMPGVGVSTGGLSTALLTRLLSSGASINQVNAEGDTPLLLAVKNGFSGSAISTLIDAGADPALPDRHGKLAWQYAFNRSPAIEKVFREKLMRGLA